MRKHELHKLFAENVGKLYLGKYIICGYSTRHSQLIGVHSFGDGHGWDPNLIADHDRIFFGKEAEDSGFIYINEDEIGELEPRSAAKNLYSQEKQARLLKGLEFEDKRIVVGYDSREDGNLISAYVGNYTCGWNYKDWYDKVFDDVYDSHTDSFGYINYYTVMDKVAEKLMEEVPTAVKDFDEWLPKLEKEDGVEEEEQKGSTGLGAKSLSAQELADILQMVCDNDKPVQDTFQPIKPHEVEWHIDVRFKSVTAPIIQKVDKKKEPFKFPF